MPAGVGCLRSKKELQTAELEGIIDQTMRISCIYVLVVALTCYSCALSTHGLTTKNDDCRILVPKSGEGEDATTFVLVHGSSHGAWCWYNVVTMLQDKGYRVAALDLTSAGRDKTTPDSVATMEQYTRPALDYIAAVRGKVIILGHSSGGTAISYIMERYSNKIEKAVFLAASMPLDGEIYPVPDPSKVPADVGSFSYGNGPDYPATSFLLSPKLAPGTFYNESPKEDVTLALYLLVPQPLSPFRDPVKLSPERYGRVRRYYIRTLRDHSGPADTFQKYIERNPPERVFEINSDHSPFFSQPAEFTSILEQIYFL